jgi:hypothetical protein
VTIPVRKDAITMADQFLTPGWYLQPGTWPYWIPNGLTAFPALGNDAWTQNPPSSDSTGGILGTLTEPSSDLHQSKLGFGGILGALGASGESQASAIPYWLQTAMPFSVALEAPRPSSDPRPQVASPQAWDSQALSNLSALPSADFDSGTPYWLRTALPSGVNSEMFGVPQAPAEQPANPVPQLWPAAARNVATPPIPPALPPSLFSVPPNGSNLALRQTPASSNTEVPAPLELDSVFARDLPARGLNATTPDYERRLDDALNNNPRPDRSVAPADAENLAFSDIRPVVSSGPSANRQWMSGATDTESGPRVVSDVTPDNDWRPGARYAQSGRIPQNPRNLRNPQNATQRLPVPLKVPLRIRDEWIWELEFGQANRLFEAQTTAEKSIARVREIDPNWRPRPSAYESVEGLIRAYEADAEQAQARLRELAAPLPPIIPRESPSTTRERNDIARAAARGLAQRWLAQGQRHVVEGPDWFLEYEPSVQAYLDPPKTLSELKQAVSTPKPGYDIHHIVEKDSAEKDGFPPRVINAPENLARIPRFKHWEITAWHMRKNKDFGGLSPRDYLRGKDWDERTRVGLGALIEHGVLKP